jgi:hypothetical protein
MVGRDVGIGLGNLQVKAGLRVAEIRGQTDGTAEWQVPASTSTTATVVHRRTYQQTSRFLGVGPRVALEGNRPLGGPWSIDYSAGFAALFGSRKLDQTVSISAPLPACLSGCPTNLSSSSTGAVFNPDAMLGLTYAFTPNARLALNYRVDAYFGAMRMVDSSGTLKNADRIYHGPNFRLTLNFGESSPAASTFAMAAETSPAFSWTGLYVGATAGGGWRDPADFNSVLTPCTAAGVCVPPGRV